MTESTDTLGQFETLLIQAAEESAARTELIELIESTPTLPEDIAQFLDENLEIIITDPQEVTTKDDILRLAMAVALRGLDNMLVRDCLAATARSKHADYADPAGMIRAIGVLDRNTPIQEVVERYEMFGELAEGAIVWHDSYRFGVVNEIDPFGGQIYVTFSSRQALGLEQVLGNLNIAHKDSLVTKLRNREETFQKSASPVEFDAAIANSFVPTLRSPRPVVEALLVPDYLGHGSFIAWRDSAPKASASAASPSTPTPSGKKIPPPKSKSVDLPPKPAPGEAITWENARSLQEFKLELQKVKEIELTEAHVAHHSKLYRFAAERPKFAADFATTLILIYQQAGETEMLKRLIAELPKDALIWSDPKVFVPTTCKLKAKQFGPWLTICLLSQGEDWLLDNIPLLPLKCWTHAEAVVGKIEDGIERLQNAVIKRFRSRNCLPDAVVWLWRQNVEAAAPAFANPRLTFEVLQKQATGDFIRGRKILHEMLMDDHDFQAALMDNGSAQGIESLVRTARTVKALDRGEQQSLLVKIVRLYPEARSVVEEKRGKPSRRKLPNYTSFRSVMRYKEELDDIINKQIPENAAAIGQARSYGDLRENFEFKAAKDQQRLLNARRSELEDLLNEVVPTDFSEIVIDDRVVPGATVEIDVDGEVQTQHLLGLWDSDPERNILSFSTQLGKALIGKKVGETVELPQGGEGTVISLKPIPEEIREWVTSTD